MLKTVFLFALCNGVFAWATPLDRLGSVSLYNHVLPGRERLPYGESPAVSYNVTVENMPALIQSHTLTQPKASDEFRLILLGDSSTWGWFLDNSQTLAGQLNAQNIILADGRRLVAYNMGYPIMSLTKDLLILQESLAHNPDMVLWLVTLQSFPRDKQLFPPIVQQNADRTRTLIEAYQLDLDVDDTRFVQPSFLEKTVVGQRRQLADLLRLQLYGFSWAATGIDQAIPPEIELRQSDFEADVSWDTFTVTSRLSTDDLAFDVLGAGFEMVGDVPLVVVNEPVFKSAGINSHLRYNAWYPHWAYDQYRVLFAQQANTHGWQTADWGDIVPATEFGDSPVHLTKEGTQHVVDQIQLELNIP